MRRFDWTRLAYLLFVLTALTILVRMGDSGAKALSFSTETRDAEKRSEPPDFKQWSGGALSDLEDARGEVGGPEMPKITEPRVRAVPATDDAGTAPVARGTTNAAESSGERETAGSKRTPPVFYRPPGSGAASTARTDSGPVCGDLGRFPESGRVVFPLEREYFYSYEDTWGAARPQGGHEGTDLMTPAGVPEYAVTDGTVVPVAGSNGDGWNTLGGYAVMVRADYSIGPVKEGDLFYYAHLEREGPLPIGTRVRAGQVVGYAGDTGQGPEVTRGLFPPHLHLGWYDGTGGRSDVDSGAMNPYPLLEWIKSNGGAVSGGSDARYCEALGPPPSAGPDWPDPYDPGVRPDIDTGSDDPRPSPVVKKDAEEKARNPESPTEGPTKEPGRTNHPDEPSKKPNNDETKRPDEGRPDKPPHSDKDPVKKQPDEDRSKVERPERPNDGPQKPPRSGPGQDRPEPPVSGPPPSSGPPEPPDENQPDPPCDSGSPKPDSPSSQYDCATGASPNPPNETNRPPKEERRQESRPVTAKPAE